MSAVLPARLREGGKYYCARGPHFLAYARPADLPEELPEVLVEAHWRRAADDPRAPGVTILVLTRQRRRRKVDERGQVRAPEVFGYALPVLMPCRWPTCGQVNRLEVGSVPTSGGSGGGDRP